VPKFPFTFTGWNGTTLSGKAPVAVKGCGKSAGLRPTTAAKP
jgi:hypothetical protein